MNAITELGFSKSMRAQFTFHGLFSTIEWVKFIGLKMKILKSIFASMLHGVGVWFATTSCNDDDGYPVARLNFCRVSL